MSEFRQQQAVDVCRAFDVQSGFKVLEFGEGFGIVEHGYGFSKAHTVAFHKVAQQAGVLSVGVEPVCGDA